MMTAMTHISFESAKRAAGDWCVGGRVYQINPTPAGALV